MSDPITTVRTLPPECHAVMPSEKEMTKLFGAVTKRWPNLKTVEPAMFARAFRVLGSFHRQPVLNTSCYAWHWAEIARGRTGGGDITMNAFLYGALAWGDIVLTRWDLENEGYLLEFGLHEYVGRLPKDEWREILAGRFTMPIDKRPKQRLGATVPIPNVLIDGKRLPDNQRFAGPGYEI